MKKLLLILTLLVTGLLSASAETVTFNLAKAPESLSNYAYANNNAKYLPRPTSIEVTPVTITLDGSANDAWRFWKEGLRAYSSKSPKFTIAIDGATITALDWVTTSGNTFTATEGTVTISGTKASWTGSTSSVTISYTTSGNKAVFTGDLVVTYEGTAVQKSPRPIITCTDNKVTITAEGADAIYYTTDNTDPTVNSIKYTEPFEITSDVTVKAISAKAGLPNSDVVTANNLYVATYANFAEMVAGGVDKKSKVTNLSLIYNDKKNKNLYLYDETKNGMLYFGITADYQAGTTFTSATGTYTLYGTTNKIPEVTGATFEGAADGTLVEPEELALEEIGNGERYKYVMVSGVTISGINGNNFTLSDETKDNFAGYNKFGITIGARENCVVKGIVDLYGTTTQIYPIEIIGGSAAEVVAAPVIAPTAGYVQAGTQVSITCATDGASIYYTIDDTSPTTASTRYNGAFEITSSCTVKAIAVKTGCQDSKVVSAEYILFELAQGESISTFDFTTIGNVPELTDNTTLAPGNTTENTDGNNVAGIDFVNGPMTLAIAKESGSDPKWWKKTDGATELRAYNKNVITIKANQNGYKLVKVMFSGDNVNKTVAASPGTYSNGVWEAPQEAAQEANGNDIVTLLTLTPSATLNVDKIQVIYVEDPNATMSAIDNIVVDGDENAPVEYFNIQGVRVNGEQLAPGLYIMRQGSKTSKIIVR